MSKQYSSDYILENFQALGQMSKYNAQALARSKPTTHIDPSMIDLPVRSDSKPEWHNKAQAHIREVYEEIISDVNSGIFHTKSYTLMDHKTEGPTDAILQLYHQFFPPQHLCILESMPPIVRYSSP